MGLHIVHAEQPDTLEKLCHGDRDRCQCSFPRLGATELPFAAAVKTGTSSDYRDAWAIGYTPRWLVGVWVGDPGNLPMARLSGFGSAAEILNSALLDLEADGFIARYDAERLTPGDTDRVTALGRCRYQWRSPD